MKDPALKSTSFKHACIHGIVSPQILVPLFWSINPGAIKPTNGYFNIPVTAPIAVGALIAAGIWIAINSVR